jgi:hypothetical protein
VKTEIWKAALRESKKKNMEHRSETNFNVLQIWFTNEKQQEKLSNATK